MAYRLRYSDYVTSEGPPDPLRWIGPPGPQGEPGPPGPGKAIIGTTPSADTFGLLWWDSVSGQLFVQYDDGSSVQWVSANSIDASTLEGSFLPLNGGGTVTGAVTVTGQTQSGTFRGLGVTGVNTLWLGPWMESSTTGPYATDLLIQRQYNVTGGPATVVGSINVQSQIYGAPNIYVWPIVSTMYLNG